MIVIRLAYQYITVLGLTIPRDIFHISDIWTVPQMYGVGMNVLSDQEFVASPKK